MTSKTDIIQGLIHAAVRDDNHLVRGAAVRALGRTHDASVIEALLHALRDKGGVVHDFAIQALTELNHPAAVPHLLQLLADKDSDVRRAAALIVGSMGVEAAVPLLIDQLHDGVAGVGHAAAESLGKLGDPRAIQPLIDAIIPPDADWMMCISASQALGLLRAEAAVPALMNLFRRRWEPVPGMNTVPPVRKHTIEALARIGAAAIPDLLAALRDPDVKLRHSAVETLSQLMEEKPE